MRTTIPRSLSLLMLALCGLVACGPSAVRFAASAQEVSVIRHDDFESLLHRYVSAAGEVDYQRWHDSAADVAILEAYLGQLTSNTPRQKPALFPAEHDALSYWINLYNGLVLREVIRRWPLSSVRDYRPTLTSKIDTTKGFFRDLRFVVGGKTMSLDDIEHQIIRKQFADARVHFALNCGSSSCPVLSQEAYTGPGLDAKLEAATIAFVNDPANVRVDSGKKRIYLSKIFQWYKKDFVAHARLATGASRVSVLDFILPFASEALAAELTAARAAGLAIDYSRYDWDVNEGTAPPGKATGQASPLRKDFPASVALPEAAFTLLTGGSFVREPGKALILSFWATYCAPCRKSLPHLQALSRAHADSLQILALSLDDSIPRIKDFLATQDVDLDVTWGPEVAALMAELGLEGLPTELFVGRDNGLRFSLTGSASSGELDRAVAELLGTTKP